MSKPVEIEFLMKDGVSARLDHLDKRAVELRGTISLLEAQLEALRLAGENASPDLDQSDNIAAIGTLEKQVESLKQKLKEVEEVAEATRVVPADLPEASRKFNGLHNSIQQMAREMPSLAMGPQMFFLAISNNLPIFTDELKRAKDEYNDLVNAGKKGTPVWKQVLGSLFSWQTAMTTGIMLLVMYGDEIVDWTKGLFSARKAVDEFTISQKEMVEIEADGRSQMVRMRFELDNVTASLKEFAGGKDEEKAKVDELNRKYGESFGYYSTVAEWYDVLIRKGEDYAQTLFMQAKVQEMVNKATEADKRLAEAEAKPESDYDTWWGYGGKVDRFFSGDSHYKNNNNGQWKKKEAIEELAKTRDGWLEKAQEEWDTLMDRKKESGLGGHTKPGIDPESEYRQRISLEKRQAEELLALRRKNQHDEIALQEEGREKKLAQIRQEYADRMAEIAEQESGWKEAQKGILSAEQGNELDRARTNARDKQDKDIQDMEREELEAQAEAMRDYLKEYGTFQQQKLAVAQEYAGKIQKAQSEGERLTLEKQRDIAIQNRETEAIKANIDWVTVFGEFGSMFSDMVKPALKEAKKYVQTDKFKNSDQASQKSLIDAINQMEKSLGGASGANFKKLGEDVKAYQTAEQNRIHAVETETEVLEKLQKAQEDYAKAQKDGTESERQAAANALETAQRNADIASAGVRTQTDIANQARQDVADTATRLKASMENLLGGLQQLSSGGLYNAYSGIIKTVNGFNDVIGKTSESLQEVPVVGWILSVIDVLKDGLSNLVGGLLDAVLNAVSGIIGDVLSGDLFVTIGESLKDGIGNILNAISFGGFNSLFGIGGNRKEVEEAINRLTDRNESLQAAIEDLTGEIKAGKGTKSVAAYRMAYENQKETNSNYLGIAMAQAGYHGSHHSWDYYWDGFNPNQLAWIRENVRSDFNGDLWSLTPEEMKQLRGNVDIWTSIRNTGKGGYGERLAEKLDDYIDQAGRLEELTDQLYEGLTGISFDGMYGSFVDNLMDMKYDAESAADDISEYFMRAMLSNKIGELYSDKLKGWWEKFGQSMEDNSLTESERNALQEEYMRYVEEAMKLRDDLAAATGYSPDPESGGAAQTGRAGAFTAMSQEQGTKLEGMFTSGLNHWASMDERLGSVSDQMDLAESHLARIAENTGNSAARLSEIREEMRRIVRDGLRMKS